MLRNGGEIIISKSVLQLRCRDFLLKLLSCIHRRNKLSAFICGIWKDEFETPESAIYIIAPHMRVFSCLSSCFNLGLGKGTKLIKQQHNTSLKDRG